MAKELPEKFAMPAGEITPKREVLDALVDCMRHKPASGADLIAAAEKAGAREPDAVLLLLILVQSGVVGPVRPDHATVDRSASLRLNETILNLTAAGDTHRFVSSPVQGSAFAANFIDRLVAPLIAKSPKDTDAAIAGQAFDRLKSAGRGFYREGRALEKTDENLEEIARAIKEFREQRLPQWYALGAIEGQKPHRDKK